MLLGVLGQLMLWILQLLLEVCKLLLWFFCWSGEYWTAAGIMLRAAVDLWAITGWNWLRIKTAHSTCPNAPVRGCGYCWEVRVTSFFLSFHYIGSRTGVLVTNYVLTCVCDISTVRPISIAFSSWRSDPSSIGLSLTFGFKHPISIPSRTISSGSAYPQSFTSSFTSVTNYWNDSELACVFLWTCIEQGLDLTLVSHTLRSEFNTFQALLLPHGSTTTFGLYLDHFLRSISLNSCTFAPRTSSVVDLQI